MELILYQIDAFTDIIFGGNPACVVPLNKWLPDEILLKIAKENAVAETAFLTSVKCRTPIAALGRSPERAWLLAATLINKPAVAASA